MTPPDRRSALAALVAACEPVVADLPRATPRDVGRDRSVTVRQFDVGDATGCPARAASRHLEPFVPSPGRVARAAGRAALVEALAREDGEPFSAYRGYRRAWKRARADDGARFPWAWLTSAGQDGATAEQRAASGTAALAFASRAARLWTPADGPLALRSNAYVDHPDPRPLTFVGAVDFVLGGPRDRRLVLVLGGVPDVPAMARAAYEALLDTCRFPPARALLAWFPDAGERVELPLGAELLEQGAVAAREAARAVISRGTPGADALERRPSDGCRYCPALDGCEPGRALLAARSAGHGEVTSAEED